MQDPTRLSARQRKASRGAWTPRRALDPTVREHHIYYCVDAAGVVVYVGRSSRPLTRLRDHHASGVSWPTRVVQIEGHGPYAWDEAVRIEKAEIRRLRPPHNVAGLESSSLASEWLRGDRG